METNNFDFDFQANVTEKRLLGLWKLLKGYRAIYIVAILAFAVSSIARTGASLLLGYFTDNVLILDEYSHMLPWYALGFIGLATFQGLFSYFSGRLSAKTSEAISRRIRRFLFDHIQRLTFTYHDTNKTGEIIQRCTSDVDAVRLFYAEHAIAMGRVLLLFLINFIAILFVNWKLGLYSIVVVPFVVLISFFFFQRISKIREAYQEQDAVLSTTLQENLMGVRVVKAFARQDYEIYKFEGENRKKFELGRGLLFQLAIYWPSTDILCAGQMIAGYLLGAMMAINGQITVGEYLAYGSMLVLVIWPIRNLGRIIVQLSTGTVSYARLTKIINEIREPLDEGDYIPESPIQGKIEFKEVEFYYDSEEPVLKKVSFTVEPGQMIALLGGTGSGKTSLVNLLPRFYNISGGQILLDGVDLNRYPRRILRENIGVVEQEPFLFSRTIKENIAYGVEEEVPLERIEEVARVAAVHDVIETFTDQYDTIVGEKGVTLSGGQKQRVAIARTLLKNPRILILDDATSSVDTETEAEIREAMKKMAEGRTTFVIAHRIQSVMDADLILVFDEGRIVQQGTHDKLIQEEGIYKEVFGIQSLIEEEVAAEISRADSNDNQTQQASSEEKNE
ncbi:MAG: ABC transporter ATP-binding protein [Anaerolineales bacterium]|nr:ABC transporter ATP-binding protein [Anaerolineales bacterium]